MAEVKPCTVASIASPAAGTGAAAGVGAGAAGSGNHTKVSVGSALGTQIPVRGAAGWRRYDQPAAGLRRAVLALFGICFALPIAGMLYFTFRSVTGGFTLGHWKELFTGASTLVGALEPGLTSSLAITAITIGIEFAIVIPAVVLIHVKLPRLRQAMGVFMLLPIAIPAIILVVGLAPVFSWIASFAGSGAWTLALAYGVLALPFVYTTLSADLAGLDGSTLAQAAESLGAGWLQTLRLVLLPNLKRGIVSCTLVTAAIALGEFTIASLLNRTTLQTALISISKSNVYGAVIITLIVLALTFAALFAMAGAGRRGRRDRRAR